MNGDGSALGILIIVGGLFLFVLMVEWLFLPIIVHRMKRKVDDRMIELGSRLAKIEKALTGPLQVTVVQPKNESKGMTA